MPGYLNDLWKTQITDLNEEDLFEHYSKCLQAHDWTYNYSDDHGVWKVGSVEENHLKEVGEACEKLDRDRTHKLFYKHNAFINEDGSSKNNFIR